MFQLKWLVVDLAEGSLCLHSPLTEKNDIRFLMKQSKLPGDFRLSLLSAHQDTRLSSVGTLEPVEPVEPAEPSSLIGITILTEVSLSQQGLHPSQGR